MKSIQKITEILSTTSWLLMSGFLILFVALFQPTLKELLLVLAVDYASLLVSYRIERLVFPRLYPEFSTFFPRLRIEELEKLVLPQRIEFFKSFVTFPRKRATFALFASVLKVLPAVCVILFYWDHSDPMWIRVTKAVGIETIIFIYFYSAVFAEVHDLVSRKIREIHLKYDWKDVFQQAEIPHFKRDFELQYRLAVFSSWTFVLGLEFFLVFKTDGYQPLKAALQVVLVGAIGFCLLWRISRLHSGYFLRGLEQVFGFVEHLDSQHYESSLPLHSSSALARFEKIINSPTERLRGYDREISQWVFQKTEQNRYIALGEISGLIIHDMSGPLHVVRFCADQFKENPEHARNPLYLEKLETNIQRCTELVESLRAYLKGRQQAESGTRYSDAHENVLILLRSRFHTSDFGKVKIRVDDRLKEFRLEITEADLIHVLYNLFTNSIENFISFPIPNRTIDIQVSETTTDTVVISLRDNGTGMSKADFERMTGSMYLPSPSDGKIKGLGLRLIRRLIERYGGSLEINDETGPATLHRGTKFVLKLRLSK